MRYCTVCGRERPADDSECLCGASPPRKPVVSAVSDDTDSLESGAGLEALFDPPLDAGIAQAVIALREGGVETFESCEGGEGHAYPEPTVRFHGDQPEGFRALAVALRAGLRVTGLRRVWPILQNEPTGPWWELTFVPLVLHGES